MDEERRKRIVVAALLWLTQCSLMLVLLAASRRVAATNLEHWRRRRRRLLIGQLGLFDHRLAGRRELTTTPQSQSQLQPLPRRRRLWELPRANKRGFARDIAGWSDEKWLGRFRMRRQTFEKLVAILRPLVEKRDTAMRAAVPADERVAICLYRLVSNNFYRTIADVFGRGHATCVNATTDVVRAVCQLRRRFVDWPSTADRLRSRMDDFRRLCGLPTVVGAVDHCPIPILWPASDRRSEYFSSLGFYAVNLTTVVDVERRFVHVQSDVPGATRAADAFARTSAFRRGECGRLFPTTTSDVDATSDVIGVNVNDDDIPPMLVADDATFPRRRWIQTPYDDDDVGDGDDQQRFNSALRVAGDVARDALAMLKARFGCLRKRLDMDLQNATDLILACCCIHNFCLENDETILTEWLAEAEADEREFQEELRRTSNVVRRGDVAVAGDSKLDHDEDAVRVRRLMTEFLSTDQSIR